MKIEEFTFDGQYMQRKTSDFQRSPPRAVPHKPCTARHKIWTADRQTECFKYLIYSKRLSGSWVATLTNTPWRIIKRNTVSGKLSVYNCCHPRRLKAIGCNYVLHRYCRGVGGVSHIIGVEFSIAGYVNVWKSIIVSLFEVDHAVFHFYRACYWGIVEESLRNRCGIVEESLRNRWGIVATGATDNMQTRAIVSISSCA